MIVVECFRLSNQRGYFYINREGVTLSELAILWFELSRIGYYKCDKHVFNVDVSKSDIKYFKDINSFKNYRGIL